MKKTMKIFSVIALCAVMIIMSVMPAVAVGSTIVEDHSVVDCVHYYKNNDSFYFLIKCPKGELDKVTVGLSGLHGGAATVSFKYTSFTGMYKKEHAYSDDKYDYTWLIVTDSRCSDPSDNLWAGLCAKIYYFDGENSKMATNTSNNSTTEGPGYLLRA